MISNTRKGKGEKKKKRERDLISLLLKVYNIFNEIFLPNTEPEADQVLKIQLPKKYKNEKKLNIVEIQAPNLGTCQNSTRGNGQFNKFVAR